MHRDPGQSVLGSGRRSCPGERDVEGRVAVEEARTGTSEKPVYSTGITGQSSGRGMWVTPKVCHTHHVGVGHGPVGGRPRRQPVAPGVLVGVVARGPPLVGAVGGDPQVAGGEAGPAGHAGGRGRPAGSGVAWGTSL